MTVVLRAFLIALGGAIGTAGRLGVAMLVPDLAGIPLATLFVNLVGALLLGVLAARIPASTNLRLLLGTGLLGGFTTYSAFATGSVQLWQAAPLLAAAYALGSVVLGLAAAILGLRLGGSSRRAAGAD